MRNKEIAELVDYNTSDLVRALDRNTATIAICFKTLCKQLSPDCNTAEIDNALAALARAYKEA